MIAYSNGYMAVEVSRDKTYNPFELLNVDCALLHCVITFCIRRNRQFDFIFRSKDPIELNVDILKKQLMDFHNYQYVTEEERLGKYSNPAIFWSQNNNPAFVPSESVFSKANYIF
ncbi:hypothetical protein PPL_09383 [Heterostelium album PN500]|uniref:Uncharacterized protein n=1 Tax=Heterostelium pallidum (strain ATCC 26659 / Pp 5 / PN500) TaxID=670386 RepID=D3BLE9_HETP5|nr:hypothetical protein PPL_09383 [Heterostelium album PN500]EFA77883.1 hypothetical protein PPL_09383 [Heterostelium album PN500]|eukprot:XP_020430011.1 hypothetical protein PPL_09383 [Heterostelium album PN500]